MSRSRRALAALIAAGALVLLAQGPARAGDFPGIGRDATKAEVAAWDIDVRPDFKGLPKGAGTVARGQEVWEARCASCHGVFGESNEVFNPLVGGTTDEDIRTGRVANLRRTDYPARTTLMKVASVSTLWDYINRAMPWNQPKSLSADEVYAVTAYLLNLGRIVPDDFELSDRNIAQVQQRLPNRNGLTTAHALWPGRELGGAARPDVLAKACMRDCPVPAKVTSMLPAFARNAHGNLAEQNRLVGAQRGADTTRAEG
ncbi:MAG TPA: cytochrome c, partial [Ramlibacter sp.]|uniref:c-type cytochrome n=1 Tax=Ramlibacter sp. TaxID=1917967 RepID=UPI002D7F0314